MKTYGEIASELLWIAHPVLQLLVAVVLWRRKLYQQFPVFFAYLLANIAIFAVLFPLNRKETYEWYFWCYWIGMAISAVLGFKVIHEVFLDVFRPYHMLKDLGTVVFKWAGVVMLMVSVVVAFSNPSEQDPLVNAVTTLIRSVRLVQSGLIMFLLLFSRFLGVSRRQQSFGIALGFGLYAGVELILLVLRAGGLLREGAMNLANMATYNLAILTWLGYSFLRGAARDSAANHLQTQRWEESLADLQASSAERIPSDSLIPMFEGMVERAISRSSNVESIPERNDGARRPVAQPRAPMATAAAASKARS